MNSSQLASLISALAGSNLMLTLENDLQILDPYRAYLQWFEGQVADGCRTVQFFDRIVLDCVRWLLRQMASRDDLVYTLQREYAHSGNRVYAEMHRVDWRCDVQVRPPNPFYANSG